MVVDSDSLITSLFIYLNIMKGLLIFFLNSSSILRPCLGEHANLLGPFVINIYGKRQIVQSSNSVGPTGSGGLIPVTP